MTRSLS